MSSGRRINRTFMAGILLVAVALRMLIPPGFMPASGRPFVMEICPEGLPADLLTQLGPADSHAIGMNSADRDSMEPMPMGAMPMGGSTSAHGHPQGAPHQSSQSDHCVFGAACGAGPIPHVPRAGDLHTGRQLSEVAFASNAAAVRVVHLPQPRAPPSRLS